MKITNGLPTTFDVYIPANISLGEVHENSGLEGADQKPMNEQVRDWLTTDDFKDFATNMGHHGLSE
ncbi:MAG: hypothetical protein LBF49_02770, partial [Puniceicoccales bacterium]|nr:hypothetical protein [Puniceicoccales bacterium]